MGANSRRRRAEKACRWERQQVARGATPEEPTVRPDDGELYAAAQIAVDRMVHQLVLGGMDEARKQEFHRMLRALPERTRHIVTATVGARAIGLWVSLLDVGWEHEDLASLVSISNGRSLSFLIRMCDDPASIRDFDECDQVAGVQLIATLNILDRSLAFEHMIY